MIFQIKTIQVKYDMRSKLTVNHARITDITNGSGFNDVANMESLDCLVLLKSFNKRKNWTRNTEIKKMAIDNP